MAKRKLPPLQPGAIARHHARVEENRRSLIQKRNELVEQLNATIPKSAQPAAWWLISNLVDKGEASCHFTADWGPHGYPNKAALETALKAIRQGWAGVVKMTIKKDGGGFTVKCKAVSLRSKGPWLSEVGDRKRVLIVLASHKVPEYYRTEALKLQADFSHVAVTEIVESVREAGDKLAEGLVDMVVFMSASMDVAANQMAVHHRNTWVVILTDKDDVGLAYVVPRCLLDGRETVEKFCADMK